MIIACPSCKQKLSVDDSMVGRQAKCSACGTVFTIATEGPSALGAAGRDGGGSALVLNLIALVGVALLLASFFVPWWGVTITSPRSSDLSSMRGMERDMERGMEKKLQKMMVNNIGWYADHAYILADDIDELKDLPEVRHTLSARVWGWRTGAGITALALSLTGVAVIVVFLASRKLRRWSWIGSFVVAAMGIPVLAQSLLWVIASPGDQIKPIISQGISAGPLLTLPGGALLLVCGIVGGVLGLRAFARNLSLTRQRVPV